MVMSFMAVVVPVEPVRAAATSITINYPKTDNVTRVGSGGTVAVEYTLGGTGGDSNGVQIQVAHPSGTPIVGSISISRSSNATYTDSILVSGAQGYYNVIASDGAGHTDTQTNAVYIDTTKPIASVSCATTCWSTTAPVDSYAVSYTGSKSGSASMIYTLQYDVGGGFVTVGGFPKTAAPGTYQELLAPSELGGTSTTCNLRFQLTVQDVASGLTSDPATSSTIYVLAPANITPTLTYPDSSLTTINGGAIMAITGTMTVTGPTASYMLSLHTDGNPLGTVYENITAGWQNVSISGTYAISKSWTVSQVSSTNCIVVLWVKDCSGNVKYAQSTSFTIVPTVGAGITVNWPTSGATMYTCSTTDNVTFTISGGSTSTSTCMFYYATENSTEEAKWTNFASGTFSPGRNYVNFLHPSIAAGNYYIRIKATTNGVVSYGYSYMFYMKALTAPTITLSAPNGGESLTGGTTYTITYSCTESADTTAPITYRISLLDSGSENMTVATFTLKNANGASSSFSWSVPNYTGANYKIRISATDPCGNSAYDDSNAVFSITAGCATTTYGIPLYSGWNLISLPLIPVSTDINAVLSPVIDDIDYVYFYNNGAWQFFVPGVTQGINSIDIGKSYWVHIKGTPGVASDNLTITGRKCFCPPSLPTTTLVYSYNGWNQIGVKSTIPQTVSGYFKTCGTSPIYLPIYYWNPVAQQYESTSDCNYVMNPGSGYMMYLNAPLGVNAPCE